MKVIKCCLKRDEVKICLRNRFSGNLLMFHQQELWGKNEFDLTPINNYEMVVTENMESPYELKY